MTDKTPSGQDAVWKTPEGRIHEFFQFNDRGPPKPTLSIARDSGRVTADETKGVDYRKNAADEYFSLTNGLAAWKNQSEDTQAA